jgi:hypothetical protein
MTNFDKQLNAAISTYSELSGISKKEIINNCKNTESETYSIITKMMFLAR